MKCDEVVTLQRLTPSFPVIPASLRQCLDQRLLQFLQARFHVRAEVDPKDPPAALGQHLEVAPGLGLLDDPEGVLLPRNGNVQFYTQTLLGVDGLVDKVEACIA